MEFRLDWQRLLSDRRHSSARTRPPSLTNPAGPRADLRTPFERDYDRVIFSAPFRRLARKTQVHPFAPMDQIHSRLTHSLEVASVGRSLGYAFGRLLDRRGELPPGRTVEDIVSIVQSACLAHDIGNPPFGHAGEFAIREWVRENEGIFGGKARDDLRQIRRDWETFEGNAQSFRMVARADNREQIYIRFTYASLGAMLKYPWSSFDDRVEQTEKYGVFSSEESIFQDLVETLGLRGPDGQVLRHPLSFLAEGADDICYQIGDFEDAVQMQILTESEVRQIFSRIIGSDDLRPLPALRAQAIGCLVHAAIATMEKVYDQIISGRRGWNAPLKEEFPEPIRAALQEIRQRYRHIFSHRPKIAAEIGAYQILGKLLGSYAGVVRSLSDHQSYERLSFLQKRYIALAWPGDYAQENERKSYSWWLGRVMDFVAGMTDNYAAKVAQEIGGETR